MPFLTSFIINRTMPHLSTNDRLVSVNLMKTATTVKKSRKAYLLSNHSVKYLLRDYG